jgi:hypothetical protein
MSIADITARKMIKRRAGVADPAHEKERFSKAEGHNLLRLGTPCFDDSMGCLRQSTIPDAGVSMGSFTHTKQI